MQLKGAGNMEEYRELAAAIPPFVRYVLTTLEAAGFEAYCVGGCVRDLLLRRTPGDWDMTTSARPEQTMALFGNCALPTGLKHGTVTVCSGMNRVETTTFRTDGAYADHRHPEQVTFTDSLQEDLSRRDFTVNAMAMELAGRLHDPFHGREDLKNGVLRCVGEPEKRFSEDALRILRCLRFAAVLRHFPQIVGTVLPEVLPMLGFDQRNPHHCYDVWEHTLHAMEAAPPTPLLRWTVLFHDMGKPECFALDEKGIGHFMGHGVVSRRIAEGAMNRLRFDGESRARIAELVEWHDHRVQTEKGVRRMLNRFGEEDFRNLLDVQRADNMGQAEKFRYRQQDIDRVEALLNAELARGSCFTLKQLAINGNDLKPLGYRGPELGRVLQMLLDRVMDGRLSNNREDLLAEAEKLKTN